MKEGILLVMIAMALHSCNGIEADVSKKLDYPLTLTSLGSNNYYSTPTIGIASHNEIDDYTDYAVYPNPFIINEVSYEISDVHGFNRSGQTNLEVSYITDSEDTIALFQVDPLVINIGEMTVANVNQSKLNDLTALTNQYNGFNLFVELDSDTDSTDFELTVYFDTTVAIDYDL